jgi:hypothetical protein
LRHSGLINFALTGSIVKITAIDGTVIIAERNAALGTAEASAIASGWLPEGTLTWWMSHDGSCRRGSYRQANARRQRYGKGRKSYAFHERSPMLEIVRGAVHRASASTYPSAVKCPKCYRLDSTAHKCIDSWCRDAAEGRLCGRIHVHL